MIQDFADWLVYKVLEFAPTQLGEAVNFFVYDTVKIFSYYMRSASSWAW